MRYDASRVRGEVTEIERLIDARITARQRDLQRDILAETDARIGVAVPKPKTIEVGGQTPQHVKAIGTEGSSIDAARADHVHALQTDSPSGTMSLVMNDDTLEADWLGLNVKADGATVGQKTTINLIDFASVAVNGAQIDITANPSIVASGTGQVARHRTWTFDRLEFYDHYNENTYYLLNVPGITPNETFRADAVIRMLYIRLHRDSSADAATLTLYKGSIAGANKVMEVTIGGSDGNYVAASTTTVLNSGMDQFGTTDVPYLVMTTPSASLSPAVEITLHWDEEIPMAGLASLNALTGDVEIVAGTGAEVTVGDGTITVAVTGAPPTAHATSHQHGGSDEVATATPGANAIPKADGSGKLDGWVSDATTTAKGKVELATDGESAANVVVQGNDSRLSNARTPTTHATSHQHGGSDEVATATPGANVIPKANGSGKLDNGFLNTGSGNGLDADTVDTKHAADFGQLAGTQSFTGDKTFSGLLIAANGKVRVVADSKFGPPVSGTYAIGDRWWDLAGSLWYCSSAGTPGTWLQLAQGRAATWSGGGSDDITATGSWNGAALLDGYRVYEPAADITWRYSTTLTKWVATGPADTWHGHALNALQEYSANASTHLYALGATTYDYVVEALDYRVAAAATCDASNYWTITLSRGVGGSVLSATKQSTTTELLEVTPSGSNGVVDSSAAQYLALNVVKTAGSPGTLTFQPMLRVRTARA